MEVEYHVVKGIKDITFKWIDLKDFSRIHDQIDPNSRNLKVIGLCLNNGRHVALIRSNKKRFWELPGGKPRPNESWEDTLRREAKEEAQITLSYITPIGYEIVSGLDDGTQYHFGYIAKVCRVDEQKVDPESGVIFDRKFFDHNYLKYHLKWGPIIDHLSELVSQRRII